MTLTKRCLVVLIISLFTMSACRYELEFNYRYIESAIIPHDDTRVIKTMDELKTFLNTDFHWGFHRGYLSINNGDARELAEALIKYDEEFFTYSILVIISSNDGASGIINRLEKVYSNGLIIINKYIPQRPLPTVMVYFTIIVELSNDIEIEEFNVEFVELIM